MTAAARPSSRPSIPSTKAQNPVPENRRAEIEPKGVPQGANPPTADVVATGGGQIWARVMNEVSSGQISSILRSAHELWEDNGRAYLKPSHKLLPSQEQKIRDFVRQVAGPDVEVELVEPQAEKVAEAKADSGGNNESLPAFNAEDDPLVQRAAEAFGAKIVNVQPKGTRHA